MDEKISRPVVPGPDSDFVIARVLYAPRERVFEAFTNPADMKRWWGPKGFSVAGAKMDLRPGGSYHYALHAADGAVLWGKFVYREIVPPQLLVYVNAFSNAAGALTRHPLSPTWPLELLTTMTFDEHVEGTLFTLRWSLLPTATDDERQTFDRSHDSMEAGWSGTLDQLAAHVQTL